MAGVLYLQDPVVTGDLIGRQHKGERELSLIPEAILTPTAWDYIRQHRLILSQGESALPASEQAAEPIGSTAKLEQVAESIGSTPNECHQAGEGRCEHPQRPMGCVHEEFGSGYVEPSCCRDCAIHKLKIEGDKNVSCEGCNRHKTLMQLVEKGQASDPEELIREVSALVVHRLEDG